ncbi:hypothetical protein WH47_08800, partial [Habropoda laboriosa]
QDDGIMDHDTDEDGAINLSTSQRTSAATTPSGDTPSYGQDQQDNDQPRRSPATSVTTPGLTPPDDGVPSFSRRPLQSSNKPHTSVDTRWRTEGVEIRTHRSADAAVFSGYVEARENIVEWKHGLILGSNFDKCSTIKVSRIALTNFSTFGINAFFNETTEEDIEENQGRERKRSQDLLSRNKVQEHTSMCLITRA